jgi:tetratricopeptide (TPR) repeat protein
MIKIRMGKRLHGLLQSRQGLIVAVCLICFIVFLKQTVHGVELEWDTYKKSGHTNKKWNEHVRQGFEVYIKWSDAQQANKKSEMEKYFKEAAGYLEDAYKKGCRDGMVLYRLGNVYRNMGYCDRAALYLKEALPSLAKNYKEHYYHQLAYYGLGYCTKDDTEAVKHYRKAIELKPDDVNSRLNIANRLRKMNRLDESEKEVLVVLEDYAEKLNPYGAGVAYNNLGWIAYKRKQFSKAIDLFTQALNIRGHVDDAEGLAWTYEAIGDKSKAKECWEFVLHVVPQGSKKEELARKKLKLLQ